MHAVRHARWIRCLVLLALVSCLGATIASPLLRPQGLQQVCAAGGALRAVGPDAEQAPAGAAHGLDCALCLSLVPPPAAVPWARVRPAMPVRPSLSAPRIVAGAAAPWQARGPPLQG